MSEIMRIPAHQISPSLRALFDAGQPVAIRCFAVLDGSIRGQIWTNDSINLFLKCANRQSARSTPQIR
jgi:hypothetical protein